MDIVAARVPTNGVIVRHARSWFILGRVSNLPTVWSNCIAGWLLGGGGDWKIASALCGGATCLYVGGMFLNDACDVAFDLKFNRERPIVAGDISRTSAFAAGGVLLAAGMAICALLGLSALLWSLALASAIVLYDVTHKQIAFAPIIMSACRFLLYPLAASAGTIGSRERVLIFGLALACYVGGISFAARRERTHRVPAWPALLLFVSAVPALMMNPLRPTAIYALLLFVWIIFAARLLRTATSRAVSMLLAGIVLIDLLALAPTSLPLVALLLALFVFTLVLQRFIPAT